MPITPLLEAATRLVLWFEAATPISAWGMYTKKLAMMMQNMPRPFHSFGMIQKSANMMVAPSRPIKHV